MIRINTFNHFAKPWSFIFTQIHGEKVGGVNCLVQQKPKTSSEHYKPLVRNVETILKR